VHCRGDDWTTSELPKRVIVGTSAEVANVIDLKVGLRWRRADWLQKVFFQEKIRLVHNSTVGAEKGRGFPKIQKLREYCNQNYQYLY